MELVAEFWADLADLLSGMSTAVTVGWPLFVVWCVVQVVWFRRARVEAPKVMPKPAQPTEPRKSRTSTPVAKAPIPSFRTGGSPEFLAALGLEPGDQQPAKPEAGAKESSTYPRSSDAASSGSAYR